MIRVVYEAGIFYDYINNHNTLSPAGATYISEVRSASHISSNLFREGQKTFVNEY
ncbi:MAG: hypothetical protein WAU12_01295 [Saprospiraceae bacterium]|nr:hypothetical protein [Saprospiraceae bacterium]